MKLSKQKRYDQVFVPSSPIKDRRYLFGREQEIKDLRNILMRPGQHAIVTGDRGVGKTSLVKHVLREGKFKAIWRTCDPDSSFSDVFSSVLTECGYNLGDLEESNETVTEGELKGTLAVVNGAIKRTSKRSEKQSHKSPELKPWTVFEYFRDLSEKKILVLDEYDAYRRTRHASKFHENTAYIMKQLADHNDECDTRLIIVGVASSSTNLLGKHESIQRSAREIYLRPLSPDHILDFLSLAESDLGIRFESRVKDRLAHGSLGYPYFVHLVGLESIEAMLVRDKTAKEVSWLDFKTGVSRAVDQAFRAELNKYTNVAEFSSPAEDAVIEGLASYSEVSPRRAALRHYVCSRSNIKEEEFEAALIKLTQEKRFLYLSRRTDEVGFIDPLMRAFIRERDRIKRGQRRNDKQFGLFDAN